MARQNHPVTHFRLSHQRSGIIIGLVILGLVLYPRLGIGNDLHLRCGFTGNIFGSVSPKDAEVAIQYWVELLAEEMGNRWKGTSRIFTDPLPLLKATDQGEFDLISLPPIDFLRYRSSMKLDPVMVSTVNGKHMTRFLLLVHKNSSISHLTSLRGKSVIFQSYGCGDAHEMWLDVELDKCGLSRSNSFFGRITRVKEASKVALPVFFGQVDACIMLDESFKVLVEMNPQLERQLLILARSGEFLGGVVLFPQSIAPAKQASLKHSCLRMSSYPRGKQILTLFRIDNLLDFPPGALDSLQGLFDEHRKRFPESKSSHMKTGKESEGQ